ncbi:MAG: DUF4013 domain-containing protein [Methanoregula sp.]|uniref:DUF4013 domain-containing protein n=1 Tax=Methanoregula sp. TaxID=2052170 RepID=UPI0025F31B54|nr:DUF4013 domain-containing protein [Methanoregula sp.]MCK9630060.1 DUF4013 domain-containing protein [Methanoregula sp.]
MDIGNMIGDSFAYAKDSVTGKWMQWLLLIIATVLLTLPLLGYSLKMLRGEKPAPEVNDWGTLFVDGIKYFIVTLIWCIPAIIVLVFTIGIGAVALVSQPEAAIGAIGGMLVGLLIVAIVAIITGLLGTIGIIRFARTGSMGEAFNFSAILETIGKIGWVSYIIAVIVIMIIQVIFFAVIGILSVVPYLDIVLELLLLAPLTIFESRYLCLVYDAAGTA